MKRLILIIMCSLLVFACNKNEEKELTSNKIVRSNKAKQKKAKSSKKTEKEDKADTKNKKQENLVKNIEGIYKSLDNCTGTQNIRIRKIEKTNSYTVEFGSLNENEFISREGYYAYFSIRKKPKQQNIEFSCQTGRLIYEFQDSNTLSVYKLKLDEEGKDLVLKGIVYDANMSKHPPVLIPCRNKEQNLFIKIKELAEKPALKFFTVKPEDAPVHVYISEFNEKAITCNSKELKFKEKYTLEELKKDIGPYIDFHERPKADLTTIEKLNVFGFELSYKTTAEELENFAKKNSYKITKKTSYSDSYHYNIFMDNGFKIFADFNGNDNSITKVAISLAEDKEEK